jgi:hypothetical protein
MIKEEIIDKSKGEEKENQNRQAHHSNEQEQNSLMRKGLIKTRV